ncbi:hypothetical protein EV356DRAFT_511113 [Viridothelium virens]|uniref:Uncharacterized protein n=1 Tax=Viridothelium virens TaxID=1048519 RepID=A0A6A6HPM9_VIRVR|nr:hypothetical protein EV356DRAFT_511113 [Viridothelium virens]
MRFSQLPILALTSVIPQVLGWSIAAYNDAACTDTSLNTTSQDANFFDCQALGFGFYANNSFAGYGAVTDDYCHVQFYSDLACNNKLGAEINTETMPCQAANPPAMAYAVHCYR